MNATARLRRPLAAIAVTLLALGACQTPAPPQTARPELTYAHRQPIVLDVARIELRENYAPQVGEGHVEAQAPLPPLDALRDWTAARLHAGGGTGAARLTIDEASLVREDVPTQGGVRGLLSDEVAERYRGTLRVRLDILDDAGNRLAEVTAEARRSREVLENISVREREEALYEMTAAMIEDLDTKLDALIADYLGRWRR